MFNFITKVFPLVYRHLLGMCYFEQRTENVDQLFEPFERTRQQRQIQEKFEDYFISEMFGISVRNEDA